MENNQRIVVRICSYCAVVIGGAGTAMAALALFLATDGKGSAVGRIPLGIGVVLFGGLALGILVPWVFRRPVLVADKEGVRTSYLLMGGYLPWRQVLNVRAYDLGSAKYIAVDPSDPEAYIQSQWPLFRPLLRWVAGPGHPVCCVPVDCRRSSTEHIRLAHAVNALRPKSEEMLK